MLHIEFSCEWNFPIPFGIDFSLLLNEKQNWKIISRDLSVFKEFICMLRNKMNKGKKSERKREKWKKKTYRAEDCVFEKLLNIAIKIVYFLCDNKISYENATTITKENNEQKEEKEKKKI